MADIDLDLFPDTIDALASAHASGVASILYAEPRWVWALNLMALALMVGALWLAGRR